MYREAVPGPDPQPPIPDPTPQKTRRTFRRASRLSGKNAFAAVFDAKMRKHAGPLAVLTRPNGLRFHRLGLSVSRKVGKAVQRNRVKRRLREAFRLDRHAYANANDDPTGYDVVIVVRPGAVNTPLADLRRFLQDAMDASHHNWQRRQRPRPAKQKTNDTPTRTSENPDKPA